MRRLQDAPGRSPDRAVRALPGATRRARPHAGPGEGRARRRDRPRPPDRRGDARGRPRRDALRRGSVNDLPTEGAPAGFAVEVPGFAGPFRLLADLILDQKVDVCDVPIASVTDAFLASTKAAEGWSLEEATWFLA